MFRVYLALILLYFAQKSVSQPVDSLKSIGITHYNSAEYSKAYPYFLEAHNQYESLNDPKSLVEVKWYLGMIFTSFSDYEKAMNYFLDGMQIAENLKDTEFQTDFMFGISSIYLKGRHDSPKARAYLDKALDLATENDAPKGEARVYNQIGLIFLDKEQLDSAYLYFTRSLEQAELAGFNHGIATAKINMAMMFADTLPERAVQLAAEAIAIDRLEKDFYGLSFDYETLAETYYYLDDFDNALMAVDTALKYAIPIGEDELLAGQYHLKKDILIAKGDYPAAIEAWEQHEIYYDQMMDVNKARLVSDMNTRYEVEKKDQEIEFLSKKVSLERTLRIVFSVLSLLFLVAVGLFFNRLRLKKKIKDQATQLLKRKLDAREREMTTMAATIARKNEILSSIKKDLKSIASSENSNLKKMLISLSQSIENNFNLERDWKEFQRHFEAVHPDFFKKLQGSSPELKGNDLRLCAYIRMNMSNKEIARLHNIESSSVITSKYRLKKKLKLEKEEDLSRYIMQV